MFEKVNPSHPDKVADRIAGALVDMAYKLEDNPKIAVEVLLGHGQCVIMTEASVLLDSDEVVKAVNRIAGAGLQVKLYQSAQDVFLAGNQAEGLRCGDNGIFKGMPVTDEQKRLTALVADIYRKFPYDGKYIMDGKKIIICQSNASNEQLEKFAPGAIINPLGPWTGGPDVDCGATNRKLGSDMADSITGGGLHGKDLSKADVSVNIYAFLKAQESGKAVELHCAIGDSEIDGKPYSEIVEIARAFVKERGGFEKFAEWGLVR